jgi:hypothetical protein
MLPNSFGPLDAFVGLLRLLCALLTLGFGVAALWTYRGARRAGGEPGREGLLHLLLLLAFLLLGLNFASWPLFYLLLQSYVREMPGVMCIYGVTRFGSGSLGPARFLPGLLLALQLTKPALVFLSGAWFVLYLLNRGTATAPLLSRVLLLLLVLGGLGVIDAALEGTYLAIPKHEEFLSSGCCNAVEAADRASRFLPVALFSDDSHPRLCAAFYGVNLALILGLWAASRSSRGATWLAPLLLLTVVSAAVNGVFLVEVAAPRLLHQPNHHCPYCLLPQAPQSVAAMGLFFLGLFAVGWACVAGWLGHSEETTASRPALVSRLLSLAWLAYLLSVFLLSAELALAPS